MSQLGIFQALLSFQKTILDSSYYFCSLSQDRIAALAELIAQQSNWVPIEGERLLGRWMESVKQSQDEYKKALDQTLDALLLTLSTQGEE